MPNALSGSGMTQFGRAMKALDIEIICANTPQAKGWVERAILILQDRLVKEMRLRDISSIAAALEQYLIAYPGVEGNTDHYLFFNTKNLN